MTSYNEIRDAIMTMLSSKYPEVNIYGEEIQQSAERPAFFMQITPQEGTNLNQAFLQKAVAVDIQYYPAEDAAQKKRSLWDVADDLEEIFDLSLAVGDRSFLINGTEPEIIDGVLHYQFSLKFTDSRAAIKVELDNGDEALMIPDEEMGYVDGAVLPMRELIKEE